MKQRVIMATADLKKRQETYEEVNLGLSWYQVKAEADRCLQCKHQPCVSGCPVNIDIPGFIKQISDGKLDLALDVILKSNPLPAICGRVCPQESQCEAVCVYAKTNQPIAIGYLERYVGDHAQSEIQALKANASKVAIVGGGPAGMACAMILAQNKVDVTIFDTWDKLGGVLYYGIPQFRLPNSVIKKETDRLLAMGVKFKRNVIVGVSITLEQLFEQGYQSIFLASGAGLPSLLNIKNASAIGVFSANEYLTRINVFSAHKSEYSTPLFQGEDVIVIGGGNVAIDAARSALRENAKVKIVYRRGIDDMPARKEEVIHALEEGIEIMEYLSPLEIVSNEAGYVEAMVFQPTQVIETKSGFKVVEDLSQAPVTIDTDMVLLAIGTNPNKLLSKYKDQIQTDDRGCIVVDDTMQTTMKHVYAGGDAVLGAATVIMALSHGQKVAYHILDALNQKHV